jgi:fructose-1,6-bisphosphatase/inositol monophosphatase family enzyme
MPAARNKGGLDRGAPDFKADDTPVTRADREAERLPILREAGGYFGDWNGTETMHTTEALATSRTLLPEVLRVLRG